ncbi:hypothetical protein LEP1GSC115_0573 [Leptospira interrogans serovar Australis str. 200703203]|uniref:Uncharacterized protein n=1 Tax=Leptospira interrogans serovar Australis str. 200703203 TaxID=1085541 RepID=N1U8C5_LEPIR|nr:hypothetical protein LEP1GSC115_0573 [Leptospira interrogans serovar Australis str. 200703203]
MDTIAIDPENPEANVRIGFMALGQKEFMIADRFLGKISNDKIKIPSLFIGKGVVSAILRKGNPVEFLQKHTTLILLLRSEVFYTPLV